MENVLLPLNSSKSADLSDLALFWSVNPFSVVASAVWPLLWVSDSWVGLRGSVNVCRGGQMGKNVLSTQNLELYS